MPVFEETPDPKDEVQQWLQGLWGEGKAFQSARQLSLAAGLSENAVSKMETGGPRSPKALIAVARAGGESPLRALALGGHLTEEEVRPVAANLTRREQSLLAQYRQMDNGAKDMCDILCRRLIGTSPHPGLSDQAENEGDGPRGDSRT